MRRFFVFFILMICLPLAARGEMYIRIIARDDSLAAQMEKLRLRDEILSRLPEEPGELSTVLEEIRREYALQMEMRPWAPAGMPLRPTIYITLGEGKGHNWWGVLFPDSLQLAKTGDTATGELAFHYPIFRFLFGWLWRK